MGMSNAAAQIARLDARIVELEARLALEIAAGFYRPVIDGTRNELANARLTRDGIARAAGLA